MDFSSIWRVLHGGQVAVNEIALAGGEGDMGEQERGLLLGEGKDVCVFDTLPFHREGIAINRIFIHLDIGLEVRHVNCVAIKHLLVFDGHDITVNLLHTTYFF